MGIQERFLTSTEVCGYCSFSMVKLRRLEKEGKLCPCRVFPLSGKRLYSLTDVELYLQSIATV